MNFFKHFRQQLATDTLRAVQILLEQENLTWEQLPWQIQFLPSVIKYIPLVGVANVINPDIDGISGMVGASKAHLNTKVNPHYRPKDLVFTAKSFPETLLPVLKQKKLSFPLFIKPVQGERAAGVQFLPSEADLLALELETEREYLLEDAVMTQSEFCISVVRDITTQKFHIFSLTERVIPTVTGDGQHSIAELIQTLPLTEAQKQKVLGALEADFLTTVLPKGLDQVVVRTASISYGTEYVRYDHTLSKAKLQAITEQINTVLTAASGFNVGRFDIKADALDDLVSGNFKVVELNGIGGMPTHVYERHLSLIQKQTILDEYFTLLNDLAQQLIQTGKQPMGFWTAIRHLRRCTQAQPRSDELKKLERKYFWRTMKNLAVIGITRLNLFSKHGGV